MKEFNKIRGIPQHGAGGGLTGDDQFVDFLGISNGFTGV